MYNESVELILAAISVILDIICDVILEVFNKNVHI